jgi:excisionase family DNA binding protein
LEILNRLVPFSVHILQSNGLKPEKTEGIGGNPMSLMDKDVVLTTNEAIKYLKISKPTFLKYIRLGRIKAIKAGNGWRVHQSELYRFLKIGENK